MLARQTTIANPINQSEFANSEVVNTMIASSAVGDEKYRHLSVEGKTTNTNEERV